MKDTERKSRTIAVKFDLTNLPAPIGTNHIDVSRFNSDVAMTVGFVNVPRLVADFTAGSADDQAPLEATGQITHHFLMSIGSFVALHTKVNALMQKLESQGIKLTNVLVEGKE